MTNKPVADVCVIIPVHNSGATLQRAIDSVLQQTLRPKAIIIADDCSTDPDTQNVLRKVNQIPLVSVIYLNKNKGAGGARNIAWENVTAKYIAFLDSDDIWHPQKLAIQYSYMIENPEVAFSCHHMSILKEIPDDFAKTAQISTAITMNPIRYLFKHYPRGGTSFVMMKRDITLRFQKNKRHSEDYLLWLEIAFNYKAVLLNTVMAYSFKPQYCAGGLTQNLWVMEKGELDTYKQLHQKGYISFGLRYLASGFSLLKYIKRKIIYGK